MRLQQETSFMDSRSQSQGQPRTNGAPGSEPAKGSAASAKQHSPLLSAFDKWASKVTRRAGSPLAFALAAGVVIAWALAGPIFQYSENWQLVINTGTTVVTFLMVFLIQQSQNKDSVALHLKLDELLAAGHLASNRMIGIEDLDEQDLRDVAQFYAKLAERARTSGARKECHSIDEEGMLNGAAIDSLAAAAAADGELSAEGVEAVAGPAVHPDRRMIA